MVRPARLLAVVGCVLSAACSSPAPVDDSGTDSGTPGDAGTDDAGSTNDSGVADSGVDDGGVTDAGSDAGCVGTTGAQLAFVSAAQTIDARACSGPLTVQLQTACGAPVVTPGDLTVSFSSTSTTTEFFGDGACIGKPAFFAIPGGSSSLSVHFLELAEGTPTLTVSAAGLDGGSQVETVACPAGEKACPGIKCVPVASCCGDPDCTAPQVCNAAGQCRVPPCQAFPHGCSTFIRYDGGSIAIASPFNPKCVNGPTGMTARFSNSGVIHPLEQDCGPNDVNSSTFGSNVTVTGLSQFGTYGFRCKAHPTFENGAIKIP